MDVPVCQGCVALTQVVERLRAEVAQLRAELAAAQKNSSNSSKPPSSDIVKKSKDKPQGTGKRQRGGQPGHQRHERPAFPPDQVDDFFELSTWNAPIVSARWCPANCHRKCFNK